MGTGKALVLAGLLAAVGGLGYWMGARAAATSYRHDDWHEEWATAERAEELASSLGWLLRQYEYLRTDVDSLEEASGASESSLDLLRDFDPDDLERDIRDLETRLDALRGDFDEYQGTVLTPTPEQLDRAIDELRADVDALKGGKRSSWPSGR